MIDGLLVLTLLSVAAVLSCFRFAGCILPAYSVGGDDPLPEPPLDYGLAILADDPVAYWRLGEVIGTVPGKPAKDEKGAHDGTYTVAKFVAAPQSQSPGTEDPPILLTGQPGLVDTALPRTSVRVNGGYVSVDYSAALNPDPNQDPNANQGFSVEAWVHPEWSDSEGDSFRCVVSSREDTGTTRHGYILYAGPPSLDPAQQDGKMYWQAWVGDGTANWVTLVGPEAIAQTTYLLLTYDGGTQTLTLDAFNGATNQDNYMQSVRPNTAFSPNPGKPLYIGMGANEIVPPGTPLYPFLGSLQEVAFYDKALTKDQAVKHLLAGGGL